MRLYKTLGRLERETVHSGQYTLYGYDDRDRLISLDHKKSDNSVISAEDYEYDDADNLVEKTLDSVATTYEYDYIDQLLSESRTGYSASYTYDANGNRASKTMGSTTETYTNDSGDKLTEIKVGTTTIKSFVYDSAGRRKEMTDSGGTTYYAYDFESRLTSVTRSGVATNTFAYNGLDTRISRVDSTGTSNYKRMGADVTDPVLGDGAAVYTHGNKVRSLNANECAWLLKNIGRIYDEGYQNEAKYLVHLVRAGKVTIQSGKDEYRQDVFGNTYGDPVTAFTFADSIRLSASFLNDPLCNNVTLQGTLLHELVHVGQNEWPGWVSWLTGGFSLEKPAYHVELAFYEGLLNDPNLRNRKRRDAIEMAIMWVMEAALGD